MNHLAQAELIAAAFMAVPIPTSTAEPAYTVVDGDTIKAPYGVTYRLMGFDTPETFRAKCDAEHELGLVAKARLEELMASGEVKVLESGKLDWYRRALAPLREAKALATSSSVKGLARPYGGRHRRESWCDR